MVVWLISFFIISPTQVLRFFRYFLCLNVKLDGDGLFFKQTMMNKAS